MVTPTGDEIKYPQPGVPEDADKSKDERFGISAFGKRL